MSELERKTPIDHAPATPEVEEFFGKADQVYAFMKQAYRAYGRMRFHAAEFIPTPVADDSRIGQESISDHMWSTAILSRAMLPILPEISKSIDGDRIRELIEVHDLGEIKDGDVSVSQQLQGQGKDREKTELDAYNDLLALLPEESRQAFMIHLVYEAEKANPDTRDKEVLLAKMFDIIQGNHYALTYGIDFHLSGDTHRWAVGTKLLPYADRLEKIFLKEENKDAATEVRLLMQHHLYQYQTQGVTIPYKAT